MQTTTSQPTRTLPAGTVAMRSTRTGITHVVRQLSPLCGRELVGNVQGYGEDASRVTCRDCRKLLPAASSATPKTAAVRPTRTPGQFEARSADGHTVYHVTVGEQPSCDCPAGRKGRNCYHSRTVVEGWAALWPAPARRPANVVSLRRRASADDLWGPAA